MIVLPALHHVYAHNIAAGGAGGRGGGEFIECGQRDPSKRGIRPVMPRVSASGIRCRSGVTDALHTCGLWHAVFAGKHVVLVDDAFR